MQEITITCRGSETLPIDRILEFQPKALKKRGKKELDKIEASIFKHGLFLPFPIWDDSGEYRLLDGHGRLSVLLRLREQGYNIPPLPVIHVNADSEAEAKQMLLQINSRYGDIDTTIVLDWTEGLNLDWAEFSVDGMIKDFIEPTPETENNEKIPEMSIKLLFKSKDELEQFIEESREFLPAYNASLGAVSCR